MIIDRKNVDIQIQNIVPSPPIWIAIDIPAREPTPIFDDRAMIRVSFGVILFSCVLMVKLFRILISLN